MSTTVTERALRTGALAFAAALALPMATTASARARAHRHGHAARTLRPTAHATARRHRHGHAARTLDGTDTAHLHLVRQRETTLFEQGAATGALPGKMTAKLTLGSRFTGTTTIRTSHGAITGYGNAKPHGTGRYQSFRGTLRITHGSGRYAHVHGHTQLYGTFDRRTFALIIHTTGRLSY